MKKYFCVSDIHSYCTALKSALDRAGFDLFNKDHILVVCGDIFDRGDESVEVYKFLRSIPKRRRIMIKGNHEELYLSLLEKLVPQRHDFSNGTVKTFCDIAKLGYTDRDIKALYYSTLGDWAKHINILENIWAKIKNKVAKSAITKWLKSDEWINYYEIDNKILVHSFIPVRNNDGLPVYYIEDRDLSYIENWRDINKDDPSWSDARWGCPWRLYKQGLFDKEIENNKTLVCGHWHASDFRQNLDSETEISDDYTTYIGKNIIALDACTALTGFVNVYTFEVLSKKDIKDYEKHCKEIDQVAPMTKEELENFRYDVKPLIR